MFKKIDFINYQTIPKFLLDYITTSLKFILTLNFNTKIMKIKNTIDIDDYFILDTIDYENDKFYLDKLWNNICYISLLRSEKCINPYFRCRHIPKTELLMYNFILSIPYKKSWTNEKLIRNIYTKEQPNENSLLMYFDDKHDHYNLRNLCLIMKHHPFSSVNKNCNEIDSHQTLNSYNEELNKTLGMLN